MRALAPLAAIAVLALALIRPFPAGALVQAAAGSPRFTVTHGPGSDEIVDHFSGGTLRTSNYDERNLDAFARVSYCPVAAVPDSAASNPWSCRLLLLQEEIGNLGSGTICPEPCLTPIGGATVVDLEITTGIAPPANPEIAAGIAPANLDPESASGIAPYDAPNVTWCVLGCPIVPLSPEESHAGTRAYWIRPITRMYTLEAEFGGSCPAEVPFARFQVTVHPELRGQVTIDRLPVATPTATLGSCDGSPDASPIPTNGPAP